VITIFHLALFGQLSFELLFFSEEDRVKLAYFFQLILRNLSLSFALLKPSGIDPYPESVLPAPTKGKNQIHAKSVHLHQSNPR
jgi:hypothetical protein